MSEKTKKKSNSSGASLFRVGLTRFGRVAGIIGAFIGAILLWLYAIGYDSTLFERTFDGVEITLEGAEKLAGEKGFTLAEEQRFSSITIVAKGKRSELNELKASDFKAVVDLSMAEHAGEQTLNIVVFSPNGTEVVSQSSSTVTVFVDEFTQRNDLLSVSVDTGHGYIMTEGVTSVDAIPNPLSVLVSGPRSELEKIEGAYVRFNLDGHEVGDNIYGYGAIELRDKNGAVINNPYISVSDTTAYVSISVTKQKTVPIRVMFVGGVFDPSQVSVSLSSDSITVSGSPASVAAISELVLEIDETTIEDSKEFEFAIGSMLPNGISNESGNSKVSVKVTLPEMSVRSYHITKEAIEIVNLPEGYTYKINSGVSVKVIGPRDAFAQIDPDAVTAVADFDNVTVEPDGSYTASIRVSLGNEASSVYVQNADYRISFTVEATDKQAE